MSEYYRDIKTDNLNVIDIVILSQPCLASMNTYADLPRWQIEQAEAQLPEKRISFTQLDPGRKNRTTINLSKLIKNQNKTNYFDSPS